MTDGVDATVQLSQGPSPNSSLDARVAIAQLAKLSAAHHPVLTLRQPSNRLIRPGFHRRVLRFQRIDRLMQDATELAPPAHAKEAPARRYRLWL